jgi:cytochrome c biogenesis protein CcmG/thiol:disulfide interchange protein DsbE
MAPLMRRSAWALAAVVLVVAFVVFGLASSGSQTAGRAAPALPRERLSGTSVTLSSAIAAAGGRAVLVVFWASWCGPCVQEAPADSRFAESPAGRGRIVGVNWSDPVRSSAQAFVRKYRWSFPNMRDSEGTVGNEYHLDGLPNTFVVDAHGRIRERLIGQQSVASLQAALGRADA